jgi:hypothetical protein
MSAPSHVLSPLTFAEHQVQGVLYRVHGYLFTRESETARRLIENKVGSVVALEHVKTLDFSRFLEILYCRSVGAVILCLRLF